MTSQAPKAAVVLFILSLVASMALSVTVAWKRSSHVIQPPKCMTLVRAGFNKMLSHIAWMRLIQFRGEMDKVTPQDAKDLARRFDDVTNLDPMFARAYEEGALNIEYTDPGAALNLLDKAMDVEKMKGKNWKIPFTAAFIAKMRLKDDQKALTYINQAANIPDRPSFVKRYAINLQAGLPGMDPLKVLNLWVDYYGAGNGRMGPNQPPVPGEATPPLSPSMAAGMPFQDEGDRHMTLSRISRLSAEIIANTQKEIQAESDLAKKKALQGRIEKVEQLVKTVYSGTHICSTCFRPYEAGDRFCKYDGKSVEVYGVCAKCSAPYGKSAFCSKCGTKTN